MIQPSKYPFSALQACADRELRLRRYVYPKRIVNGQMTKAQVAEEISMMAAIVAHFADLAQGDKNEELFRDDR